MHTNFDVGDFDFEDDDGSKDLIRPPDPSKRETLIEDTHSNNSVFNPFSNFDINLDEEFEKTLQESRNEYEVRSQKQTVRNKTYKVKSYDVRSKK